MLVVETVFEVTLNGAGLAGASLGLTDVSLEVEEVAEACDLVVFEDVSALVAGLAVDVEDLDDLSGWLL